MCLIAFALDAHPRHALVLAANRDEAFARPAAPLAAWDDVPGVVAGRDLAAGGTWLGVRDDGRWAALTNVRDPSHPRPATRSRGHLVTDFLRADDSPQGFAEAVYASREQYDGFNLVVGQGATARVVSTHADRIWRLEQGVYGLSNDILDTPWPKVSRARSGLRKAIQSDPVRFDDLFALLDDRDVAPDERLPDTGVGIELERVLSPVRIVTEGYGTRVSTALVINQSGLIRVAERTWNPDGTAGAMVEAELSPPATRA